MPIRPNWQTATLLQAEETSITSTHTGRTYRIQAATLGERPAMVKDTFQALMDLGYAMHRNRIPGEIMMENGF